MIFFDGTTTIDFDPINCQHRVEDFTNLMIGSTGAVIAAAQDRGLIPQRTRQIVLDRTTAELVTLKTFLVTNVALTFDYTDDAERVWNVKWLGLGEEDVETLHTVLGHHRIQIELLLESVKSDASRIAYANTDVSQMSIQKAGATQLFFPLAYQHPLTVLEISASHRRLTSGFLQIDAARHTQRLEKTLNFSRLSREFMSVLEDYYVETLKGAQFPFTLVHFRDTTASFRFVGGFNFRLGPELSWAGSLRIREEI